MYDWEDPRIILTYYGNSNNMKDQIFVQNLTDREIIARCWRFWGTPK